MLINKTVDVNNFTKIIKIEEAKYKNDCKNCMHYS